MSTINIIGSGISGLSAACYAAKEGHHVSVFEKNSTIGGRARVLNEDGFVFDMGPSWYWMPDIFENFFNHFGKRVADYYNLVKLDPGFRIFYEGKDYMDVPPCQQELDDLFESIEPGSSMRLHSYLADAEYKYKEGMLNLACKPSLSWLEFADIKLISGALGLSMFVPISRHVRKYFKDPKLIALMEFPVLFLGAMPDKIPALYSLMNFAALKQGTFYPMGGMHRIIEAMEELALSLGVTFHTNTTVEKIEVNNSYSKSILTSAGRFTHDVLIATGDYRHIEQDLLEPRYQNYPGKYWDKKTFAPSCLIFYLGVKGRLPNLQHHNLFFDTDMDVHAKEIYENPSWPENPLFYVCCPSKTDDTVAPVGHENLFVLVPVATGLKEGPDVQDYYYKQLMERIEARCGVSVRDNVVYKKAYSVHNFEQDYNAYKGNAYGLANTLGQTAVLKPKMRNEKIENLFYAGQLTVPGPGVPPCIISGQLAVKEAMKHLQYIAV